MSRYNFEFDQPPVGVSGGFCGAGNVARMAAIGVAVGVGVGHGGKVVVEPVVGAPGLAFCIAASRVAISAGDGVGSSVSGEAKTGEVKVVDVLPPLAASEGAQGVVGTSVGVGNGDSDVGGAEIGVGVCTATGGGVAIEAQAVTTNRQTQAASAVINLECMMSLPGLHRSGHHITP